MKTIKRIIVIIFLVVVAMVIGYLAYTSSRMTAINDNQLAEQIEVQYDQC
jgi:Tfp pilus assembly protein PilO